MEHALAASLVCPICKGKLVYHKAAKELVCKADRLAYPIVDDIPVMLAAEARELSMEVYDKL